MLRIVVAPDKFKGSLTAPAAADAMARGVRRAVPEAQFVLVPMADGGEGTVEALVTATSGKVASAAVSDPLGRPVKARFGVLGDRQTVVIEMAAASGLPLLKQGERDPFRTTTFGTGELLNHALSLPGIKRVLIGIGGSATNDGGAGLAQALFYRFYDDEGHQLEPTPNALVRLARIDASRRNRLLDGKAIDVACDVDNPLIGPRGASAVFGPQKFDPARPATHEQIAQLDAFLDHFASIIKRDLGVDIAGMPGAGAAGGLGGGLVAFAGARLTPGVELIMDAVGLRAKLAGADLCLTGEGALDASTAGGKVVSGVARLCKELVVPCIALCGAVGQGADSVLAQGLDAFFSICNGPMPLENAVRDAEALLEQASEQVVRAFLAGGNRATS